MLHQHPYKLYLINKTQMRMSARVYLRFSWAEASQCFPHVVADSHSFKVLQLSEHIDTDGSVRTRPGPDQIHILEEQTEQEPSEQRSQN